jgi:hypothetical protein
MKFMSDDGQRGEEGAVGRCFEMGLYAIRRLGEQARKPHAASGIRRAFYTSEFTK